MAGKSYLSKIKIRCGWGLFHTASQKKGWLRIYFIENVDLSYGRQFIPQARPQ